MLLDEILSMIGQYSAKHGKRPNTIIISEYSALSLAKEISKSVYQPKEVALRSLIGATLYGLKVIIREFDKTDNIEVFRRLEE